MREFHTIELDGKLYNGILIDATSIVNFHFEDWFQSICPKLQKNELTVSVPHAALCHLEKWSMTESFDRAKRAAIARNALMRFAEKGFVTFVGDCDAMVSAVILEEVMRIKTAQKKALVITQDAQLAKDVIMTNYFTSAFSPAANVKRINTFAALEHFNLSRQQTQHPASEALINKFRRF